MWQQWYHPTTIGSTGHYRAYSCIDTTIAAQAVGKGQIGKTGRLWCQRHMLPVRWLADFGILPTELVKPLWFCNVLDGTSAYIRVRPPIIELSSTGIGVPSKTAGTDSLMLQPAGPLLITFRLGAEAGILSQVTLILPGGLHKLRCQHGRNCDRLLVADRTVTLICKCPGIRDGTPTNGSASCLYRSYTGIYQTGRCVVCCCQNCSGSGYSIAVDRDIGGALTKVACGIGFTVTVWVWVMVLLHWSVKSRYT